MNDMALVQDECPSQSKHSLWFDAAGLTDLRRQMLLFSTSRISDVGLAEDAVQEALMGALKSAQSFSGRSAFRTWVFAILRNKIVDAQRHKQRMLNASSLHNADDGDADQPDVFDLRGCWQAQEQPGRWGDPEGALHQRQFWSALEACLSKLPAKQARVFMMKEFLELDSDEICATVGITTSNLNVMLHRARLRLRGCLEGRYVVSGRSVPARPDPSSPRVMPATIA